MFLAPFVSFCCSKAICAVFVKRINQFLREMESGHVTDDVSAPDSDTDDVNNPFHETSATSSTSANISSDLRTKLHPGTVSMNDVLFRVTYRLTFTVYSYVWRLGRGTVT